MDAKVPPGPPPAPNPTPVVEPDLVARLRHDLAAAGFTVDGVAERLGPVASAALHREQPLPAILVTATPAGSSGPESWGRGPAF
ncbi:MAG: hypothetical protein LOY02_17920, partial [Intrasporangium sp.]|nr:hypothetical protein [Intrasporangium sp.]